MPDPSAALVVAGISNERTVPVVLYPLRYKHTSVAVPSRAITSPFGANISLVSSKKRGGGGVPNLARGCVGERGGRSV